MVRVSSPDLTGMCIPASGLLTPWREMAKAFRPMEISTMANGNRMNAGDRENIYGKMATNIMEPGSIIEGKALVCIFGKMATNLKECGKRIKETA